MFKISFVHFIFGIPKHRRHTYLSSQIIPTISDVYQYPINVYQYLSFKKIVDKCIGCSFILYGKATYTHTGRCLHIQAHMYERNIQNIYGSPASIVIYACYILHNIATFP